MEERNREELLRKERWTSERKPERIRYNLSSRRLTDLSQKLVVC